jgi:hypothetical protein
MLQGVAQQYVIVDPPTRTLVQKEKSILHGRISGRRGYARSQ